MREVGSILAFAMTERKIKNATFGNRLAQLRKSRGTSQVELAAAVGVTQGLISLYEKGISDPTGPVLAELARALHVSTDALLGIKPLKSTGEADTRTRSLWKRFQKMRQLPRQDQRAVIRLLNSLVSAQRQPGTSRDEQKRAQR